MSVSEAKIIADLASRLTARGLTVATAESLTGGRVAAALTSRPGSSAYFQGGVVAYANQAKIDLLGVPAEVLALKGAVSEECARAMAEGARRRLGTLLAVATTGIAGPDGGSPAKPVGLVWLATATDRDTRAVGRFFPGDRATVTRLAVRAALELLSEAIA
ncbi:MAG: nicotinamide-nucleotide amidohydrolase family protein [Candidatus Adiutrix sp.]|jgi:nicotinamide-nucleotide amidase|nr:nicotinamide-nucleotide amidohydrolase family protein [Candidatus Adiutrix sp.]